jgi:maltooligosyltrehalose synthase
LTLAYRRSHADLFRKGDYLPIISEGSKKDHLCAFARRYQNEKCLVIAPRFFSKLAGREGFSLGKEVWDDTKILLPDGMFQREASNLFTGERLHPQTEGKKTFLLAREVFSRFPVALMRELRL